MWETTRQKYTFFPTWQNKNAAAFPPEEFAGCGSAGEAGLDRLSSGGGRTMVGPPPDHKRTALGPRAFKMLCISCVGDFGGLNVLVVSGIGAFFDGFSAWAVNL